MGPFQKRRYIEAIVYMQEKGEAREQRSQPAIEQASKQASKAIRSAARTPCFCREKSESTHTHTAKEKINDSNR